MSFELRWIPWRNVPETPDRRPLAVLTATVLVVALGGAPVVAGDTAASDTAARDTAASDTAIPADPEERVGLDLGTPSTEAEDGDEMELPATAPWQPAWYDGSEIGLLDAVRLTLGHSPIIQLQVEDTRFSEGFLLESQGEFDLALQADLGFDFLQQEVRASERRRQREQRETLQERVDEGRETVEVTERILNEVRDARQNPDDVMISDPELQATVDLFNFEISRADDPQERDELIALRDTALNEARLALLSDLADARMTFEEDSLDLRNLGAVPEIEENYEGLFNLQIAKRFRTGVRFAPFFEYSVLGDRYQDKPRPIDFGGKGLRDLYRSRVGFTLDAPLLRGRGKKSTGAREKAAKIDLEASRASLEHAAASEVLRTVLAYWELVAARQRVAILEGSVTLQGRLLELTDGQIEADELPASESARARARDADIRAARDQARRDAHEARLALALAVGLAVSDETEAPWPADDFPPLVSLEGAESGPLIAAGLARRRDYEALLHLEESGGVLAEAAKRDRRPVLDFASQFDYNAADETDGGDPFLGKYVGPSLNVDFAFDLPFKNRTQRGRYAQALADERGRMVRAADLDRRIRSNVILALGSLRDTLAQLDAAQEAAEQAQLTIDAELERYRLGESTLIDTLLTEQRLTEARLAQLFAQLRHAQLVAQLRFETGTLVDTDTALDNEAYLVDADSLITLPTRRPPRGRDPDDDNADRDPSEATDPANDPGRARP